MRQVDLSDAHRAEIELESEHLPFYLIQTCIGYKRSKCYIFFSVTGFEMKSCLNIILQS